MKTIRRKPIQTTTAAQLRIEFNKLRRRVFIHSSSEADERYFKLKISEWLAGNRHKEWMNMLFEIVHERNGAGLTLKYCYYNDHTQKIYLKSDFVAWAKRITNDITDVLVKLKESY